MKDSQFHQVSFLAEGTIERDRHFSFLQNNKLNLIKKEFEICKALKEHRKPNEKMETSISTKILSSLKRAVDVFLSIGYIGETFNLAINLFNGYFFTHFNSYFQTRIRDAVKAQDLKDLNNIKREAKDLKTSLLKAKAKIKDTKKKKQIQDHLDKLDKRIEDADKQLKKV